MLLYQFRKGTNPRRVIIYLAEKGIDIPRYELDYEKGEHRSDRYLDINTAGRAPTLITDSGLAITESAAIVEYLEELHPDRPMIGAAPLARARVRSLERLGSDLIARSQLWLWNRLAPSRERSAHRPKKRPSVCTGTLQSCLMCWRRKLVTTLFSQVRCRQSRILRRLRYFRPHAKGSTCRSAVNTRVSTPGTPVFGRVLAQSTNHARFGPATKEFPCHVRINLAA
jgi:hypothetical protein